MTMTWQLVADMNWTEATIAVAAYLHLERDVGGRHLSGWRTAVRGGYNAAMKTNPTEKGQSVRLLRIGEQVRHALAAVLLRGDLRDDLLANTIVSVSEVRVTPDLRQATAYVKPLGDADEQAVIKALASHAKYLRGEVAKQLQTKYTPDLRFRRDESFDAGARIDAILRRPDVARDLVPPPVVRTIDADAADDA